MFVVEVDNIGHEETRLTQATVEPGKEIVIDLSGHGLGPGPDGIQKRPPTEGGVCAVGQQLAVEFEFRLRA